MLKATEKALRASIKHWEEDWREGNMDTSTCALCGRFLTHRGKYDDRCSRFGKGGNKVLEICPVFKASGIRMCDGTPYNRFPNKENAVAEIKFLMSLLPEATE